MFYFVKVQLLIQQLLGSWFHEFCLSVNNAATIAQVEDGGIALTNSVLTVNQL